MAMEMRQELKLSQQLVMTPQLQQAIKILQLSLPHRARTGSPRYEEVFQAPVRFGAGSGFGCVGHHDVATAVTVS